MKKLLVFFLAVSLFAACDNNKSKDSKREKSSETRTKDDYGSDDKSSDGKSSDDRTSDEKEKTSKDMDDILTGWSSSDEDKFMNDCEGTAKPNVGAERAREYCDCMLKKIKKMYSSYTEADRELAGSSQTELNRMANECNGK